MEIEQAGFRYEERVVGFVDILGFRELVKRADCDQQLRSAIIEGLRKIQNTPAPDTENETDLRHQNFSDCLIISAHNTPNGFWHLVLSLDALAWSLLKVGILVRGGVTVGNIHHDKDIVFGIAVNDAHRLESKIAKFPRIILSRSAVRTASNSKSLNSQWSGLYESKLQRDQDGVWFLDHFKGIGDSLRNSASQDNFGCPQVVQDAKSVGEKIQCQLDDALECPAIYEKIHWLALRWNISVVGNSRTNGVPLVPYIRFAG